MIYAKDAAPPILCVVFAPSRIHMLLFIYLSLCMYVSSEEALIRHVFCTVVDFGEGCADNEIL